MKAEIWIPVVVATVVGIFGVINTVISRKELQPVRDVLRRTKVEGQGSLVDALGALSKEYKNSQMRHAEEIKYFMDQLSQVREELAESERRNKHKDEIIAELQRIVKDHERRLNESHIGDKR